MNDRRKHALWMVLLLLAVTMLSFAGCAPKEEVTDKGYYTGTMKPKSGGGLDAPGVPGAPSKRP